MLQQNTAPPFVPSDPNAPEWMIRIEKKRFVGEWKSEQRKRFKLLKRGLPVPPMPEKFRVEQTAQNAETTGYPQIGPDTSAFIQVCNYSKAANGAMEDSSNSEDDDMLLDDEPQSGNHLNEIFNVIKRLKTDVNKLRFKPHMPFDFFNKKVDNFIYNPTQLVALTTNIIKLYIAPSKIDGSGVGLYTATSIPPHTVIAEYFGHLMKIETQQFQRIEALEAPFGYTNNGVLMFPDLVNKQYFAIFPAANKEITCAAYFANYNKDCNMELHRAYTREQQTKNLGIRQRPKRSKNQIHSDRPRFFLFSKGEEIPPHTELCWNYGLQDEEEVAKQGYFSILPSSLLASQQVVDEYTNHYEKNIQDYLRKIGKMLQERHHARQQRRLEEDSWLDSI